MLPLKFSARLSESPRGEPKPPLPSPELRSLPDAGSVSNRTMSLLVATGAQRAEGPGLCNGGSFLTRSFFGFQRY